jgi:hypothetical protein
MFKARRGVPMKPVSLLLLFVATLAPVASAQTPGLVPLTDLGTGLYQGFQGGLYPGGSNAPPPAHLAAAVSVAQQVVPRDAQGSPHADGLVGLIAIGMSNTCQEFAVFERQEDLNPSRNPRVVIVDTAQGGQTAAAIASPAASYWTLVSQRLQAAGLSAAQVQVAWLKEADAQPPNNFPGHAQVLRDELKAICNILHDRFPNLRLCYVSSRIYSYAAQGSLNPEPQAYESGFAVKWLIEAQINGDPQLNYSAAAGPVRSPLLLWGPYLWANGTTPRSDGLVWLASDLEGDLTHPGPAGEQKVADMLSAFLATDPAAAPWWGPRVGAALVTLDATKDAYVQAAAPGSNFGALPQLLVQGGASPTSTYVAFDASALPRPARYAKLGLRIVQAGGGPVSTVADSSWDEAAITFGTAPPVGPVAVNVPSASREGTFDADVTGALNADPDGVLSLALATTAAAQASYRSRESGQPPRLTVLVLTPCAADANADGLLTPADIGAFVNTWLLSLAAGSLAGDFDGNGAVAPADVAAFVAAWFGALAGGC